MKTENLRNQDAIGEKELLVLSFGTSYHESRRLTIGAIEESLETAFPAYAVRRGFTSDVILHLLQHRDGICIDSVPRAMERAIENGVKTLVIQPTHLMNGLEYDDLVQTVEQYRDKFETLKIGAPLLSQDRDFTLVEKAVTQWLGQYDDGKTAICLMGHGTEAKANCVYEKMQETLWNDGFSNYFVGTVEATPSLSDLLKLVQQGEYTRVILTPLMVVAGDHANNDMAGAEADSWQSVFTAAGYQTECLVRGLGENAAIRQIYVEHVKAVIESF
jgi:sirohydrochlorin cobaltochelatase